MASKDNDHKAVFFRKALCYQINESCLYNRLWIFMVLEQEAYGIVEVVEPFEDLC